MKRMFAIWLSAALLLSLLPACNPQGAADPTLPAETASGEPSAKPTAKPTAKPSPEPTAEVLELTPESLVRAAWSVSGQLISEELHNYCSHDEKTAEKLSAYVREAYGLEEDEWEEGALVQEAGASAFELAALRFADEDAARHGEECLKEYVKNREGDFTGHAPFQARMVARAEVCRQGTYVGLFICENSDKVRPAFEESVKAGMVSIPPYAAEAGPRLTAQDSPFDLYDLGTRLLVEALRLELGTGKTQLARTDHFDSASDGSSIGYERDAKRVYGVSRSQYLACAVAYWQPDQSKAAEFDLFQSDYELVLFLAEDESGAQAIADILGDYLAEKEEWLRRRGEEDAADLVAGGRAARSGRYVMLAVSEYADEAVVLLPRAVASEDTKGYTSRYFQSGQSPAPALGERVPFVPPNKEDMSIYDTAAIRAAWAAGEPSGLSEDDRAVYDAAREILGELLADGMTELEKEAAIYGWLVDNVNYDWRHQDVMAQTPRSSYEPYGGLVDHRAVCLGYATSFQLLCDLAGVECITVVGAYYQSEEDHAWNMVRLNGNWYGVDATWDANGRELGSGSYEWRYFNLTSDEMAQNHQWDYDNMPEAAAEDRGQG